MKVTSRIRTAGITTIITALTALLVIISAVGLTFAEGTPQAATEATLQSAVQGSSQSSVQEPSQTGVQETPQATVEIIPPTSKPFGPGQHTPSVAPMVAKIASIVNMKVEDVIAARHEGKSFLEIAAENGISESELVDALIKERKAFLDTQVAQGRLTSEQAATVISKMEENLKVALSRREVGPPETRPNIGQNIGRKNMSRMHAVRGRAADGKDGSMKGFSQGFQAGRRVGLRQGLGFGKGLGKGQGPGQNQGQGQGVCPFCGQTCPFCGQTQEPAD